MRSTALALRFGGAFFVLGLLYVLTRHLVTLQVPIPWPLVVMCGACYVVGLAEVFLLLLGRLK